jgi:hypothetical protein
MLFLNIVCMKNRRVINLDLLYLKIYKCIVAAFWICSVLCNAKILYQKLHKFTK